jgi:hypothetical protein
MHLNGQFVQLGGLYGSYQNKSLIFWLDLLERNIFLYFVFGKKKFVITLVGFYYLLLINAGLMFCLIIFSLMVGGVINMKKFVSMHHTSYGCFIRLSSLWAKLPQIPPFL